LPTATALLFLGLGGLFTTSLTLLLAALLLLTFAFFCAHATASAWVGSQAVTGRAQATAIYTLAYYLGASLFGWLGGVLYDLVGWSGTVALALSLTLAAALVALRLRHLPAPRPALSRTSGG
ncbi:MFS transporter, partial [Nocardiopsis alkaliphila]|uniref:MFS transporter n=1 Tax=Nocardiopsis alkaliphila TaxID=225762 RepID=UPI000477AF12